MTDFDYGKRLPDGQFERHPTLPKIDEFVRPVRDSYRHTVCNSVTKMGRLIAETYAARPSYYGMTFCTRCRGYFPVGSDGDFVWIEQDGRDGPKVGT